MTEDEYMSGEPDDYDDEDEMLGEYLIEEPDDLTLIVLPKLEFDLEKTLDEYYKILKKCRNKEQIVNTLRSFYAYIYGTTSLMNDIQYLQDRAKEIEFNIAMLQNSQ